MILKFKEIQDEIAVASGLRSFNDFDTEKKTQVKLRINQIQDWIFFDRPWEWRKRTKYFTTRKPEDTGTISVTQNSRTVTGAGTSWTEDMKGGFLLINSKFFKIDEVASGTSLTIVAPYPDATAAGESYKITFPTYILHPDFSMLLDVINDGQSLSVTSKERRTLSSTAVGRPSEVFIWDRNDQVLYETGTVSVTNGSTAVTGAGTTWTTAMEGQVFQVNGFSELYVVKTVGSATALTLQSVYRGSTGSGKTYKINPEGSPLIRFSDVPDDYYFMEVEGFIKSKELIDDDDMSLIPDHAPLLHGSIYLALADREDRNPVLIQQKRADFERTLKQLQQTYKAISNIQWKTPLEETARRFGRTPNFNPLADDQSPA